MPRFFFSKKALTKAQNLVIAVIAAAAIFAGVVYYLSLPAPGANPSPTSPGQDSEWILLVDGLVQRPLNLTLDELVAMPRVTVDAEIYCSSTKRSPIHGF